MLTSPLPPFFLDIYNLSTLSQGIYAWSLFFLFFGNNLFAGLYPRLWLYVFYVSMNFVASFGCYFSTHIDRNLLRNGAIMQSAFYISYNLGLPGILFISRFLDHTEWSHYYWFGGSFKMPHFFNFYFQVFIFPHHILWLISYYLLAATYQLEGMFFFYSP